LATKLRPEVEVQFYCRHSPSPKQLLQKRAWKVFSWDREIIRDFPIQLETGAVDVSA